MTDTWPLGEVPTAGRVQTGECPVTAAASTARLQATRMQMICPTKRVRALTGTS